MNLECATTSSNSQSAHEKVDKMIVNSLLSILASAHVLAAEAGGPPKVDIGATCRASENDLKRLFGNDTMVTYDGCLNQENSAFDQLVKDWSSYPAADKAQCVQTQGYMPSYVEWLTCLEIQMDLGRIREQEKAGREPSGGARNSRN